MGIGSVLIPAILAVLLWVMGAIMLVSIAHKYSYDKDRDFLLTALGGFVICLAFSMLFVAMNHSKKLQSEEAEKHPEQAVTVVIGDKYYKLIEE